MWAPPDVALGHTSDLLSVIPRCFAAGRPARLGEHPIPPDLAATYQAAATNETSGIHNGDRLVAGRTRIRCAAV